MARLRRNFTSGTITDNPLTLGATTINSAGFASLPVVASPDIITIVLDPLGTAGAPEIAYITAHTTSATAVTALRGQETALGGGAARQHAQGIPWLLVDTAAGDQAVAWDTYTPTWTTNGTAPSIGNGVLAGRWTRLPGTRTIIGTLRLTPGTTTNPGTGAWFLSLPVAANTAISNFAIVGGAKGWGGGPSVNAIARLNNSATQVRFDYSVTSPTGTETPIAQNQPWNWTSGTDFDAQFLYEAAS